MKGASAQDRQALIALRDHALPLNGGLRDRAPLLDLLGQARFALLGEASHGTHEFYRERAEITKRLIIDRQYNAVVVEADWPDAARVNRYVRALPGDRGADEALSGFERFPTWMWRNTAVLEFVQWLRAYNETQPERQRVGFYGMDLYSLFGSIQAVLAYLDRFDAQAAQRARQRYACFDHYQENIEGYGYAAGYGVGGDCEDAVVAQLMELARRAQDRAGQDDPDALFHAHQNALLVKNAEHYYRSLFRGRASSWNLRDAHMVETVEAVDAHLASRLGFAPRIAIWAHNSHLGDARATEMGRRGEWNVGQLMRERYPGETMLLGFSTYTGTVTAASHWDAPARHRPVRPGLAGSWEALFHQFGMPQFALLLQGNEALRNALATRRLQRAIGVVYAPQTERQSHYLEADLVSQFDAMVHIDETHGVEPLERDKAWMGGEVAEALPSRV